MQLLNRLKTRLDTTRADRSVSTTVNADEAYRVLSNDRRRRVIGFLAEADVGDEVSVGTLAERLSDGTNRTACYISLTQNHMSALGTAEGIGVIDYNRQSKTVTVKPELHVLYRAKTAFEENL